MVASLKFGGRYTCIASLFPVVTIRKPLSNKTKGLRTVGRKCPIEFGIVRY